MSDSNFFREVDEAVRQDRYKQLWDKYGVLAIGVATLIIVAVAGYKGWVYWRAQQAADAGTQFSEALRLDRGGDSAKAKEAFDKLATQGPDGYRVLARFQLAMGEAKAGQTDKAVSDYDALAADPAVDPILQGYATIQAATLKLDSADYAEMQRRLGGLITEGGAWRYSARELLGFAAYKATNMTEAEKQFSALVGDASTPQNLRDRADMMLSLIAGSPTAPDGASK